MTEQEDIYKVSLEEGEDVLVPAHLVRVSEEFVVFYTDEGRLNALYRSDQVLSILRVDRPFEGIDFRRYGEIG